VGVKFWCGGGGGGGDDDDAGIYLKHDSQAKMHIVFRCALQGHVISTHQRVEFLHTDHHHHHLHYPPLPLTGLITLSINSTSLAPLPSFASLLPSTTPLAAASAAYASAADSLLPLSDSSN